MANKKPKAKRTNRTPKKTRKDWKPQFLKHLSETGNIENAAAMAFVGKTTVYQHRNNDPQFGEQMAEALEEGIGNLKTEAYRRAVLGTRKPVFHQGEICGTIQEFSDTLLMFLIKGRDPSYRDTLKHQGDKENPIEVNHRGSIHLVDRIDQLSTGFESLADRTDEGGSSPDGTGEPLDTPDD